MASSINQLSSMNWITVLIAGTLIFSIVQGMIRGASSSARYLALMATEGAAIVSGIVLSWWLSSLASPYVQEWLVKLNIVIPSKDLGLFEQFYYTLITAVRDFPLLRSGILFIIGYAIIKQIIYRLIDPFVGGWTRDKVQDPSRHARAKRPGFISSVLGGVIGTLSGLGRSLLIIAVLFIYTTFLPQTQITPYIQASTLYQKGAATVINPVAGEFLANQLPVFTRQVEAELNDILQRKYEVLDAQIPSGIAEAAKEVTLKGKTDEEKAKLLYQWIGTRVTYDWDKVNLYEQKKIWKEQTPEDTYATKKGVCIDYSRLYAVMARSIGLEVKVVTGLGYDGRGGYGPHAWNEVYLNERSQWIPLDSTWVASGGNWFNPPNFNQTHIREV
ncbi:Transglutaminase-like enzyme, putative cysteine protease [Paenibacillus sp. 1_12]|uniref:transglutaminase domain-containing protein n=1 Tax=Paenibacillus sp. 1_12 TaxID=1566278 RepID=UPI0008ECCCBA|nr:transglutaminase domain-containing protein [Paenibacillus sp. 1_12]SFK77176.1 Transglutaminase-like enzyme, putative cysteine protease [Paenibacillus sp. 1_12]